MKSLFIILSELNSKQRIQKAVRHLNDAILLRAVRHDIDSPIQRKSVVFIYNWQTNIIWNEILFLTSFIYPMLSFFEEIVDQSQIYNKIFVCEIGFLNVFLFDLFLETFHRFFDKDKQLVDSFIYNHKYLQKVLIFFVILADFIYYLNSFPKNIIRFGKYIRPFLVLFYSKELRRTFQSIIQSLKEIIQLIILVLLITFFFAIIGWKFIGDLDNQSNFQNITIASNILYSLISFDGYPDCMMPAYSKYLLQYIQNYIDKKLDYSVFYIIYFLSYLILYLLIFIPIPVAVVFEAFRVKIQFSIYIQKHIIFFLPNNKKKNSRSKLVIMDRIKQKEALLACFVSLDFSESK
ncbi:hypothetical protein IMG5_149890 [Ichthyophthirius multifiliis]|uniref:Ion transport domain-containing protein n=1 Tax=Ichthyophthirius multifiliis TaxID=5932 RepID=G0QYI2_ICHMU|nr:hypothetical protein IMG5_149890 [Ichthyophthirius multifiliis]EGR29721.1 hypothetical protein IMG5_149890 [Ichthyophthirius multifiliis]|eukprot:XP_004030957.1 hypothetical protein IMG5_149890 [Ichthyophthirius multifiliis]